MTCRFFALAVFLALSGCATGPASGPQEAVQRPVCADGILVLGFNDGDAALAPRFAAGLEWPSRAFLECPNATFKVIGLPAPSDASLSGRRARSVALALRAFGVPEPAFEPGRTEDQVMPVLQINAAP